VFYFLYLMPEAVVSASMPNAGIEPHSFLNLPFLKLPICSLLLRQSQKFML